MYSIDFSHVGLSFNQPKFCSSATWDPNAVTVANVTMVGIYPPDMFVDLNNTIYVANRDTNKVQIWLGDSMVHLRTISGGSNSPHSIFVARNGDIYVDNSELNGRIDRWTLNATTSTVAMYVSGICFSLFIDINDDLYCSMETPHQVSKRSLYDDVNSSVIVAGNGTAGNLSSLLNGPRGIFVDINLNLYVADCWNHRIQFFPSGELIGKTLKINGSNETFTLNVPTEIVFDNDGYLYIADCYNNRILGSDATGFRCIVGCSGIHGSASNQLSQPHSFSFDSYGNIYVIEELNNRLQKFFLASGSCGKFHTIILLST